MTKTMTFAAVHFSVAYSVFYVITGSAVIGGVIALVEPAINTIAYYFHGKAWNIVSNSPRPEIQVTQCCKNQFARNYSTIKF